MSARRALLVAAALAAGAALSACDGHGQDVDPQWVSSCVDRVHNVVVEQSYCQDIHGVALAGTYVPYYQRLPPYWDSGDDVVIAGPGYRVPPGGVWRRPVVRTVTSIRQAPRVPVGQHYASVGAKRTIDGSGATPSAAKASSITRGGFGVPGARTGSTPGRPTTASTPAPRSSGGWWSGRSSSSSGSSGSTSSKSSGGSSFGSSSSNRSSSGGRK